MFYKRNAFEKIKRLGLNETIASIIANIYCIDFIHDHIFNNKLVYNLKRNIRKRAIFKRQGL